MDSKDYMKLDSDYILGTYGRMPAVIDHGDGAYQYDVDGKRYVDFASGIGTLSLGATNPEWIKAVTGQLSQIQHISNYYYSPVTMLLAEMLTNVSSMSKVFFANSGAEANEGAIKTARKYSSDKYGSGRSTIVTFNNSFHGRTVTTLAATGQERFHKYFSPFTEGFKYTPLNDEKALAEALTKDVCAVMCEPIQGEGGVNLMTDEFAAALKSLCREKDILIIADEVQTGIGRTGKMFAYEHFAGFKPDIITVAKGLGGGLPIGAFLCNEKTAVVLGKGDHGSTFGGNPVCCAGATKVLEIITAPGFLKSVSEKGEYLMKKLCGIDSQNITEVRGKGLMIGIEIKSSPKEAAEKALEKGLLVLTAGSDVVRLLPPLTITKEQIDEGVAILAEVL